MLEKLLLHINIILLNFLVGIKLVTFFTPITYLFITHV